MELFFEAYFFYSTYTTINFIDNIIIIKKTSSSLNSGWAVSTPCPKRSFVTLDSKTEDRVTCNLSYMYMYIILFPNKRKGGLNDHLICRNINIASSFKDWLLKKTFLSENASEKKF